MQLQVFRMNGGTEFLSLCNLSGHGHLQVVAAVVGSTDAYCPVHAWWVSSTATAWAVIRKADSQAPLQTCTDYDCGKQKTGLEKYTGLQIISQGTRPLRGNLSFAPTSLP